MEVIGNIPGKGLARIQADRDQIKKIQTEGGADIQRPFASPGFIDIQLNGFGGVDFCDGHLEVHNAPRILPALWKTGVASSCPTVITNTYEAPLHNFRVLEESRRLDSRFARPVACYHPEGHYISPGPSHGAHDPRHVRPPNWEQFRELQVAAGGRMGIVTIAPELPGADEFIRRARNSGVVVALGHTDAAPGQIHAGIKAGATLSTHLGNGNPQTIDRHRNTHWPQMAVEGLSASLICNRFHLPADLIRVILRTKGIEHCILITDAVYVAGLPPGRYTRAGLDSDYLPTGQVMMADHHCMAGLAVSMDRTISVFMQATGVALFDSLRAATVNRAGVLSRLDVCKELAEGQLANLTLFRVNNCDLKVEATILAGEVVYSHLGQLDISRAS